MKQNVLYRSRLSGQISLYYMNKILDYFHHSLRKSSRMQLITFQWNGLRQRSAKQCNITSANGVIFAPFYGAGKRKAGNNGTPERHYGQNDATAHVESHTTTTSLSGTACGATTICT